MADNGGEDRLFCKAHGKKCLIEGVGIGRNTLSRHAHPSANARTVGRSGMMSMLNGMGSHADVHGSHQEHQDNAQQNGKKSCTREFHE